MPQDSLSIHYKNLEPLASYGINHFIQKFGIQFTFNEESKINVIYVTNPKDTSGFNIYISEDEAPTYRYLNVESGMQSLFEKTMIFEKNSENSVFIDNKGNGDGIRVGFDIFNEVGRILTGYLEHFWRMERDKRGLAKVPVVDYYEKK